jgi:hypothetical protein
MRLRQRTRRVVGLALVLSLRSSPLNNLASINPLPLPKPTSLGGNGASRHDYVDKICRYAALHAFD